MFKAEWAWFGKHKFYILVLSALILVPVVYVVVFLSSLWNPYGETRNLPVAVVNHDQQQKYQGKQLKVGDDLAKSLHKSHAMKFSVVDAATAKKGLRDGKYYMTITIPRDFSKNATTLLDKHPKQMQLNYTTSSGHGFVAGKMADAAAGKIVNKVSNQVTSVYAQTLVKDIKQLGAADYKAGKASNQLATGVGKAKDGATKLNSSLGTLANGTQTLQDGNNKFANGLTTYLNGVGTANEGSKSLQSGVQSYTDGVAQASDAANQLQQGLSKLNDQLGSKATQAQLAEAQKTLPALLQDMQTLQKYMPNNQQLTDLSKGLDGLNDAMTALPAAQEADQKQMAANITKLNLPADEEKEVLATIATTQANSQSAKILNQLQTQAGSLMKEYAPILQNQSEILSAASDLQSKAGKLQGVDPTSTLQSLSKASSAITQLADGSSQLNQGLQTLNSNSAALNSGTQQLSAGLNQLAANNGELQTAEGSLQSGIGTLNSGSQQLFTGSKELAPGLGQAQQGNQDLAKALNTAGNQTKALQPGQLLLKQIAQPTVAKAHEQDRVPNNGTGMTPYMFSVGLYVGMLSFNIMMDMVTPRRQPKRMLSWFGAKMSVLAFYSIAAASIVYALSIWVLGLNPVNPLGTYGMLVLTALTFGAIVTALNLWFKKPGAFLAVVFLVLQLSGSAGTYPIQTSNKFFEWLHPYLPMTYSVNGFRETIMIGGSAWPDAAILLYVLLGALVVMGAYYGLRTRLFRDLMAPAEQPATNFD